MAQAPPLPPPLRRSRVSDNGPLWSLADPVGVVVEEELLSFLIADVRELGQPFEIAFSWCSRGEQQQQRRWFGRAVVERVTAADWNVQEIPWGGVDPVLAVEKAHRPGEDVE